jgi:hypothetical protein
MAKPLVVKRSTKIRIRYRGASMLFYPAALPLSARTLSYVAGLIRRHRKNTGSCWRKLSPGQQGLLVLAYLRKGETFASLAAGFGIGTATAWRYVTETVALLAARSRSSLGTGSAKTPGTQQAQRSEPARPRRDRLATAAAAPELKSPATIRGLRTGASVTTSATALGTPPTLRRRCGVQAVTRGRARGPTLNRSRSGGPEKRSGK